MSDDRAVLFDEVTVTMLQWWYLFSYALALDWLQCSNFYSAVMCWRQGSNFVAGFIGMAFHLFW